MREIAEALGLSHQRIHQIVDGGQDGKEGRKTKFLDRVGSRRGRGAPPGALERLSEDASAVLTFAEQEARALNHNYLGTEHMLLGLLRAQQELAGRILFSLGVGLQETRTALEERLVGRGDSAPAPGPLRWTPRSKKVLEAALKEAQAARSVHVGTEHLLLGLARVRDGLAARLLLELGIDEERVRRRLRQAFCACSLCGRGGLEVEQLVAGPGVFICSRCIELAGGLLEDGNRSAGLALLPPESGTSCSFCRKSSKRAGRVVAGQAAAICAKCISLCEEIERKGKEDH